MNSLDAFLHTQLQERKKLSRYRRRITLSSAQGEEIKLKGRTLLNFCSNDYLGLANHPKISETLAQVAADYGVGSGASHLVCGHSDHHHALECELASFTGRDRVLLFSTGYMANMGVLSALAQRQDEIFQDRLNHASLIDGALLARARHSRYKHCDLEQLACLLQKKAKGNQLVVTDGVFSMDGDLAPLPGLASLAERENAWLMVDDAHGFGVLGEAGAGTVEHFSLSQAQVPILVGTFGKAFGTFGAFVAGSEALIESLIQFARPYVYTTALPSALAAATKMSLTLVKEDAWRRQSLRKNIAYFRQLCEEKELDLMPSHTPIQPLVVGDDQQTLLCSDFLKERGILVSAIRPPTVPDGTARLRVTLGACHQPSQLEKLVETLDQALEKFKKG